MKNNRNRRWLTIAFTAVLLVILLAAGVFVIWAETPLGPMPEALAALETNGSVRIETEPWLTFWPQDQAPTSGVILYPGGRIDPRSYAPAARALAELGHLVVITPMPLNLAVLNPGAAADVLTEYPEIETWVIGGHSLGGSMAARYAADSADVIDGLVLWASYPADNSLATGQGPAVLSIYGTNDGLSSIDEIEKSRADLPSDTRWVEITSGNHAQFGWYGEQPRDGQAAISRQEQQEQIVSSTHEFLELLMAQAPGR